LTHLEVGVVRSDITPPTAIAHTNWGAQIHQRAEGVDLPLTCTALVARQGNMVVAIVDLDLIWLLPEQDQQVRQAIIALTGIAAEHIRLSYGHTHSGPVMGVTWASEGGEYVPGYMETRPARVASTVREAILALRPARVAAGTGACGINVNRRGTGPDGAVICGHNWDGFVDREVVVVRIDALDETPIATIVNYACHPTIMGPPNRLLTPDYPGAMKRAVEAIIGGTCLFLQGATGNIAPIYGYVGDPAVYHRAGKMLAIEAARVRLTTPTRPHTERLVRVWKSGADLGLYEDVYTSEADATLAVAQRHVQLPLKPYPPVARARADFDRLAAELERVRVSGTPREIEEAVMPVRRAELALYHARLFGNGMLDLWVQAIRLGPVGMVAIPVEPFAEIGAAVKARSPFSTPLFSGYSNGYYGYLPTREAYVEGGYEVTTSPYLPDAADRVIEAAVDALAALT